MALPNGSPSLNKANLLTYLLTYLLQGVKNLKKKKKYIYKKAKTIHIHVQYFFQTFKKSAWLLNVPNCDYGLMVDMQINIPLIKQSL